MTDTAATSPADKAPEEAAEKPAEKSADEPEQRPDWWVRRYTFTGTAVALVFLWLSMTPSLLPRGPLFQGLVSGAAGAIGYALGVFSVWLARFMLSKDNSPRPPKVAWLVLVSTFVADRLQSSSWRLNAPVIRRLLAQPDTR